MLFNYVHVMNHFLATVIYMNYAIPELPHSGDGNLYFCQSQAKLTRSNASQFSMAASRPRARLSWISLEVYTLRSHSEYIWKLSDTKTWLFVVCTYYTNAVDRGVDPFLKVGGTGDQFI